MAPHLLKRAIRKSQLVGLLAPTLGPEKSELLVASAIRTLGLPAGEDVRVDHVLAILDHLAAVEGLVGVAARFVKARGQVDALLDAQPQSARAQLVVRTPNGGGAFSVKPAAVSRVSFEDISLFLAPALGDAVARESVAKHAATLGIHGPDTTHAEAARVLESMSQVEGIVGVVASFARARFILKHPA